ncbi:glutamate receptor ionotropic, delta-2-like isoform X2 [Daphnia pulicaria]|uniref:glutamate receptor ionotropic, delta-2-like isoform X2 n=1 Tax=Daphnia pulicaria TaxID=35523 RepID=UPI001EEC34B0|nr:glutamate receptor ionotropic, delta-2-like isoform X2 [Daphnia pulicaria]
MDLYIAYIYSSTLNDSTVTLTQMEMKRWIIALIIWCPLLIVIGGTRYSRINKHLRVATFYNPLGGIDNISVNNKGLMENEILETLAYHLNFTRYDIVVPNDTLQLGLPGNESWSGVLGLINRKEADVTISFGPVSYPKFLAFDVTVGIIMDHIVIMIPYPEQGIDASGLISNFCPVTWVCIAVSTVIVTLVLWLIGWLQKEKDGKIDGGLLILYILAITFSQGGYLIQKSTAFRMVQSAWLLALLVLAYAYSGSLISKLTAPKNRFLINSLEDAAANEDVMPLVVKDSSSQEEFLLSPVPSFQEIARRWQEHPELLLRDSNTVVDLMSNKTNHIFIGSDINARGNIERDYRINKKCRVTLLPKLQSRSNGLFLQKNSILTSSFNAENLRLLQAGILRQIAVRHSSRSPTCSVDLLSPSSAIPTPLRFNQLDAAFYVLAAGGCLSLAVFFIELAFYYWKSFQSRVIVI